MIKKFSTYVNEQYSNPQDTVNLKYGNPQKNHVDVMNRGSSLYSMIKNTDLWKKWTNSVPPLQSSEVVKKSLEELILIGNSQTQEDLEFVKDAENNMRSIFVNFLKNNGADYISEENLQEISDQLYPITFRLKYIFNYPRPYQLAGEFNIPLYPSQTTDACSPSYPSGHTIDSYVMSGLLGKKFPQLKEEVEKLGAKISKSRLQGGIHFNFDEDFGKQIAEDILSLNILSL